MLAVRLVNRMRRYERLCMGFGLLSAVVETVQPSDAVGRRGRSDTEPHNAEREQCCHELAPCPRSLAGTSAVAKGWSQP